LMRPDTDKLNSAVIEWSSAANLRLSYDVLRRKPIFSILEFADRELLPPNKFALDWNILDASLSTQPRVEIEMENFDLAYWPQLDVVDLDDAMEVKTSKVSSSFKTKIVFRADDDEYKMWLNFIKVFKVQRFMPGSSRSVLGNDCGQPKKKVQRAAAGLNQALEKTPEDSPSKSNSEEKSKSRSKSKSKTKKPSSKSAKKSSSAPEKSSSSKKKSLKQSGGGYVPPEFQQQQGQPGFMQQPSGSYQGGFNQSGFNPSGFNQGGFNQGSYGPQGSGGVQQPPQGGSFYQAMQNAQRKQYS